MDRIFKLGFLNALKGVMCLDIGQITQWKYRVSLFLFRNFTGAFRRSTQVNSSFKMNLERKE